MSEFCFSFIFMACHLLTKFTVSLSGKCPLCSNKCKLKCTKIVCGWACTSDPTVDYIAFPTLPIAAAFFTEGSRFAEGTEEGAEP